MRSWVNFVAILALVIIISECTTVTELSTFLRKDLNIVPHVTNLDSFESNLFYIFMFVRKAIAIFNIAKELLAFEYPSGGPNEKKINRLRQNLLHKMDTSEIDGITVIHALQDAFGVAKSPTSTNERTKNDYYRWSAMLQIALIDLLYFKMIDTMKIVLQMEGVDAVIVAHVATLNADSGVLDSINGKGSYHVVSFANERCKGIRTDLTRIRYIAGIVHMVAIQLGLDAGFPEMAMNNLGKMNEEVRRYQADTNLQGRHFLLTLFNIRNLAQAILNGGFKSYIHRFPDLVALYDAQVAATEELLKI